MDIDGVIDGNRAFAAQKAHEGLAMMPREFAMIVGCADPRVDPERVLGMALGDVAVVRNIGGRVVPPVLDTLAGFLGTSRSDLPGPGLDVDVLRRSEVVPGMRVWGLVYDVATGLVEVAGAPAAVAS